ncbi:MAG: flagellar motor protein, partial [Moraxellaceae bacterium]
MDFLSIVGVILGFAVIIGGNFAEGGSIHSLLNGSAAVIVFGGTLAAAILQTPKNSLKRALSMFKWVFKPPYAPFKEGIAKLVRWANAARKDGLLGLRLAHEL